MSETIRRVDKQGVVRVVQVDWTAAANGAVTAITTKDSFLGRILGARFVHGSPTPTNLYDATIKTVNGDTVLTGTDFVVAAGATYVAATGEPFISSTLVVGITGNSVNAAKGTVFVYIEE